MPDYQVLSIGDAYDFGAIEAAANVVFRVTTSRDPLRARSAPSASAPTLALFAKGDLVYGTGTTQTADGIAWAEVMHPDAGRAWSDSRYLAPYDDAAAVAASQAQNDAAQAAADKAAADKAAAATPKPAGPLATGGAPKPAGITPAQLQVSASMGGWTLLALIAAGGAIWYVMRDKGTR